MDRLLEVKGRVLLVGPTESLAAAVDIVQSQGCRHQCVSSSVEALKQLRSDPSIDLVLLVPGNEPLRPHIELCRNIKFDRRSSFVAVIGMLSPVYAEQAVEVLTAGADDCISMASPRREILLRLLRAIRLKQATDCMEDAAVVITALAGAIEGKDHYTCGHVERVSAYSVEIGRRMGVDAAGLAALKTGGIVHDIGKVGIPDQVLNKPGRLTDEEMAVMKRHSAIGYDLLKPLRTFHDVLPLVRWHHEKPGGGGYPDGLKGDELPLLPRILAVADCFDALSTDRPYRPAFPLDKCRAILLDSVAKGELDGPAVDVLLKIVEGGMPAMGGAVAA